MQVSVKKICLLLFILVTSAMAICECGLVISSGSGGAQSGSSAFTSKLTSDMNSVNNIIKKVIQEQDAINNLRTEQIKQANNVLSQYNLIDLATSKQEAAEREAVKLQCVSAEILINTINSKIAALEHKIYLLSNADKILEK